MIPKRLLVIAALMVVSLTSQAAQAGELNDIGRYLGWGWSNGYHSRCGWNTGLSYTAMAPMEVAPAQYGPITQRVPIRGGMPVYRSWPGRQTSIQQPMRYYLSR